MSIFSGTVELGDVTLELMLWDPAGVDPGGQFNRSFISGASGLIFVVDATEPRTLDYLLEAHAKGRGFIGSRPAILVVNKSDRTGDFALSKAQIDAASKLEWRLVKASAKTGDDVNQVFAMLAEMMLEARKAAG